MVGAEVISIDGWGGRSHPWGAGRWGQASCTTTGRFDDGATWYATLADVARP